MTGNIIITGANNGIGLAMIKVLLEMGDLVAALDLSLENLGHELPNLLPFRWDVTDPEQIQKDGNQIGFAYLTIAYFIVALAIIVKERTLWFNPNRNVSSALSLQEN